MTVPDGPGPDGVGPDAAGPGAAGPAEWAERFRAQARACDDLGSPLSGRLLRLVADDLAATGPTWEVLRPHAGLRFGQAAPLRLAGAAHRLALTGVAPGWAACLPTCGGVAPDDASLASAWQDLVGTHAGELSIGLGREVQTNEVGRSAALAYGTALAGLPDGARLVELGCAGGLNLHHDRYDVRIGPLRLGTPGSSVRLEPEVLAPVPPGVASSPVVTERVGLDPHPLDVTTPEGLVTLTSFVWPDQVERFERVRAAAAVAAADPADLRAVPDTAVALGELLAGPSAPTLVQHSVVWQYVPTDQRWRITDVLERAGERATPAAPLVWLRYEPDEWDRRRAGLWLRRWPGGGDRLLAQVDFHGRWIRPVPA